MSAEYQPAMADPTQMKDAIRAAQESGDVNPTANVMSLVNRQQALPEVRRRIQQSMEIQTAGQNADIMQLEVVPTLAQTTKHYDDMPLLGTLAKIQSHVEAIQGELDDIDGQIKEALMPPKAVVEEAEEKEKAKFFVTEVDLETSEAETEVKDDTKKAEKRKDKIVLALHDVVFPGFNPIKTEPLPAHIPVKDLLTRMSKMASFNRKSDEREYNKVMTSPDAENFINDMFWWWFCDNFQPNKADQEAMFGRLACSFVNLVLMAPPKMKDEVMTRMHDTMSQAVYSAFHVAFPSSRVKFQAEFKTRLSRMLAYWTTGAGVPEGSEASHWAGGLGQVLMELQTVRAVAEDLDTASDESAFLAASSLDAFSNKGGKGAGGKAKGGKGGRNANTGAKKRVGLDQMLSDIGAKTVTKRQTSSRERSAGGSTRERAPSAGSSVSGDGETGKARSAAAGTRGVASTAEGEEVVVGSGEQRKLSHVPTLRLPPAASEESRTKLAQTSRAKLSARLEADSEKRKAKTHRGRITNAPQDLADALALTTLTADGGVDGDDGAAAGGGSSTLPCRPRGAPTRAGGNGGGRGGATQRSSLSLPLAKFDLVSNSPLVRHWLSAHAANDVRVSQFTKLLRGVAVRDEDHDDHFYQSQTGGSLERSNKLIANYDEVKRNHQARVKQIRANMMAQKRALDHEFHRMVREKTFHSTSNRLVSKDVAAVMINTKVLNQYATS